MAVQVGIEKAMPPPPTTSLPHTESQDRVWDHLRNLNIRESMGPNEMHPRVTRVFADAVNKPFSMVFEKLWQSSEIPGE